MKTYFVAAIKLARQPRHVGLRDANAALAAAVRTHAFYGHQCSQDGTCYLYGKVQRPLIDLCQILVGDMWSQGVYVHYAVSISPELALKRLEARSRSGDEHRVKYQRGADNVVRLC